MFVVTKPGILKIPSSRPQNQKTALWTNETKTNGSMEKTWKGSLSEAYCIICKTHWRQSDGMDMHGFHWHKDTTVYRRQKQG